MNDNLREELVQVAAVAVAILEDLDYGVADTSAKATDTPAYLFDLSQTDMILSDVSEERHRQDEKWGPQHNDPFTWLLILMEEVGEFAEEVEADPKRPGFFPEAVNVLSMIVGAGRWAKKLLEEVFSNDG